MLEKETDYCQISSFTVLNFKDDDTNVFRDDSDKGGGKNNCDDPSSLTTQADLICLNENGRPLCDGETWTTPVNYQFLPEEYFKVEGIPPPLVSISWLKLLNESDEDSGEDIPLSKLKNELQKKKEDFLPATNSSLESPPVDQFEDLSRFKKTKKLSKRKMTKSKVDANECPPINRKRGRPKKCDKESTVQKPENDFSIDLDGIPEDNEFFWNEQSASSDLVIPVQEEAVVENEKEKDNSLGLSQTEHGYFKATDAEGDESKQETKEGTKKKKRERTVIRGIKTEDSKISFPCIECGKSFSAASTLKSHLRIHNGTLLICTECHRGFTTKYLLKCHMRIHNGDLFMCHKCGKGFTTAELLKVHSRGHTGDRPFFCNICKRSFPSASNLSQHKQTHNSEKKFLCFQCGSSFSQKRCLDGHMLTHAEKNHICNVCGKLWARKSDLSEHMRVHTGVKPYCCNLCPQKFTQASSLKRHKIVHMEIKPIQCLTCSKMFKCQEYYKRHLRKHEKEADYLFNNVEEK